MNMKKLRKIIREAISRQDDLDILQQDPDAWLSLIDMFHGAEDGPLDYEWFVTPTGYKGKGPAVDEFGNAIAGEYTSLSWDGFEWQVGDWAWE